MRLQSKDTLWLRKELYSCCLLGWSEWMAISLQQPTMQAFSWVTWVPEFPRVVVHVSKGAAFYNRPFPSSKNFHFQNEAKCKTFLLKMTFIFMTIKSHFYINGFALNLALKERLGATWKWPITPPPPREGLPSLAYAGVCRWTGYGFQGLGSGYIISLLSVLNKVSFWTGSLSKGAKTCGERSTFAVPIIFFLNIYFLDFSVKNYLSPVLNRVRVWRPRRHSFTQTSLDCSPGMDWTLEETELV